MRHSTADKYFNILLFSVMHSIVFSTKNILQGKKNKLNPFAYNLHKIVKWYSSIFKKYVDKECVRQ